MASRRLVLASVHEALLGIPSDIASLARISHEWCPKLHFGDGKDVGGWVARAKMPAEGSDWAWTSGGEGNDDVKSDYRDSYPDQRSERWYV